ncbi:LVIVD repeat-containing protein [Ohtaekwangia koreensis]|uniref:LVIVD repeat-containing protein n=1 Tax=Ohtaekwangia koreensis TaxID=688867 RepID=A0A1T5M392_9BACT|nr:hypothetical protein [Ohtaekwangia koreensis]SKC82595.1 LVIVD repeat-containing protein [Ohtaekwangia koreensis]
MRFTKLFLFCLLIIAVACDADSSGSNDLNNQGTGGSMTRFAIHNGFMYIADQSSITVFDIRNDAFEKIKVVDVEIGLETIFAYGEYLYLGANSAMYIYSITDPQTPTFIFRYSHIYACDPVVVQGNRAYVTMRTGSACNRGANALEIIDITDRNNPSLIANYPMESPHGLGVDNNLLFICEGEKGLKVFDISHEESIQLVTHIDDLHAYDVIPGNGILLLTGDDGVFQYRYDDAGNLLLLSKIPVNRSEI